MKKRLKSRRRPVSYQPLEERKMLAGDVSVFVNDATLFVRGDAADNQIQIVRDEFGDVVVSGQGTTINGGMDEFRFDTQEGRLDGLRVHLGRGDDAVFVEDLNISGRAVVYGGAGDDSVGLYQNNIAGNLLIQTSRGDDLISVDEVNVGGNLVVFSLNGDDFIGIDASAVGGQTIVVTGHGHDDVAIANSMHRGDAFVLTQWGDDFVGTSNVVVDGRVTLATGFGSDDVYVDNTMVGGVAGGGAILPPASYVNGGFGSDRLEIDGNTGFVTQPTVKNFEGDDVAGGRLYASAVFNNLISSGARLGTITELAVLTPELSTLVGAVTATGLDTALNGPGPFTVFAPLNSAFDKVADVVAGLDNDQLRDVLLFHAVSGEVSSSQLVMMDSVMTLLGQSFTVDLSTGQPVLNGNAMLAATDIRAKNGVIHLLNDVLVPAAPAEA